jgi:hypothetical protein
MTNHEIRRLPVETGTSGWVAVSTRLAPVRPLDKHRTAD